MNYEFYRMQMAKLSRVFGDKHYSAERVKTIWNSVHNLSDQWFENLVNSMIVTQRQPPLPIEFMEAAKRERRKTQDRWEQMDSDKWRKQNHNIFTDEERAEFFSVIRKILNKEMTVEDGCSYAAIVQKTIDDWKAKHPGHFSEAK